MRLGDLLEYRVVGPDCGFEESIGSSKREQPLRLEDLIPEGVFVGTSLILKEGERFLFGIRPAKVEGDRPILELTGIGGRLEQEDESYAAGVRREAQEEIGCDVVLVPCARTLVVSSQHQMEWVELQGPEQPAALVLRRHRTPPHQPWHAGNADLGYLVVYLATLAGSPRPVLELPWLAWLKPEQVLQTARKDVHLADLLETGAELVSGDTGPPPRDAWVRLTDSQEALGLALGECLPQFYRSLDTEP